jgi:hypothetical protein
VAAVAVSKAECKRRKEEPDLVAQLLAAAVEEYEARGAPYGPSSDPEVIRRFLREEAASARKWREAQRRAERR